MADNNYQSIEEYFNQIRVLHLPFGITAKEITTYFEPFGTVKNLHLRRRVAKDSPELLPNPNVILIFDRPESVDQIMAARPFYMGDCRLFIRRCLPNTPKYPYEPFLSVKKILIRTPSEKDDQILPDDESIVEYLSFVNGKIEYFERLNDKTVLVQFDDYDPVDVCCLSRPHFIKDQLVEVEKCSDEEQVRHRVESQQKLNSVSTEVFSISNTIVDINNQTMNTTSPTPILSIDDQMTQLRSSYNDMTSRFEREHEQLVASLTDEWKQTAKERIRFQRLTLDYKQELERIEEENRKWQKLFSDSIKEKPIVQREGERKLNEVCQKYEHLIQKIPKETN